jgi:glutamine phosphoribosylpyrophosphate amidotransferase
LESKGYRFNSNCDSEIIAVYIADKMANGVELEKAMHDSLDELDGVFTYVVATKNQLGMAKDYMAAKPMVIYESKDIVACASEEVAIRNIFPHEIPTYDPYEAEVKVWQV